MRILGIDPGSYVTGFGLVEENSRVLKGLESGVIRPSARQPVLQRLLYIHDEFNQMLDQFHPDQVAVERNKQIVPKPHHADTPVEAGDRLEIVTIVGGG